MKIHSKKKAYKVFCKDQAKKRFINDASGRFVPRASVGGSMMRDYYPQK